MSRVADAFRRPSVLIETPAKNNYIFEYQVAKCNARFIKKKNSQLKNDIQSCRCKSFSLK